MEEVFLILNSLTKIIDPQTLLIGIGLGIIYRRISTVEAGVREGLLAHISHIHNGAMRKGSISKGTLMTINHVYEQYKALKGNGYAENLMNDINKLEKN